MAKKVLQMLFTYYLNIFNVHMHSQLTRHLIHSRFFTFSVSAGNIVFDTSHTIFQIGTGPRNTTMAPVHGIPIVASVVGFKQIFSVTSRNVGGGDVKQIHSWHILTKQERRKWNKSLERALNNPTSVDSSISFHTVTNENETHVWSYKGFTNFDSTVIVVGTRLR